MGKAAGAVVAAGLGLVGLGYGGLAGQDNTTRDETGQVVDGGELGAFRIKIGDCFIDALSDAGEVESVQAVPCNEPHDNETYGAYNVTESVFPGEDAIVEIAAQGCYDRFEPFVGQAYETSALDIWYMYPTEESWNGLNDREVLCVVVMVDGSQMTSSVRSSGL